jgi:glycosyltransferase involved in cell wall biosynthesis
MTSPRIVDGRTARRQEATRPLRVVHVTLGLEMGGQEKLLVEFARHAHRRTEATASLNGSDDHAIKRTVDLHFVSLTGRGVLADELEACGWPVTALHTPPGLRPELFWKLFRLFRSLRADVVHTHDDRPQIYGAPAGKLAGARVIHTRHSQGTHLSARQRLLVRAAASFTDRFVCISHTSTRAARAQGIPSRLLRTLWNGIDTTAFSYTGPDSTGPAVVVARLAPEKDLETLLRAVALLAPTRPGFRLEVAGEGSSQSDLVRLVREWNLGEQVRFLGAVRDVPALLARARLFVLSSITEGISLTLLEAMARGLPVVTTAVGGNVEVVEPERTGLLVPARDPAALAGALVRLWDDPELGRRLGQAGRARVEAHFDVRRMVAAYEDLYSFQRTAGAKGKG